MLPITEVKSRSPIRGCKSIDGTKQILKASLKQTRRKKRWAKTTRYTDEEILNSRLKNTRVRLNVGGEVHEVMWRTLKRMPFTRLGLLRKALSHDQIMELCDDYDLEKNEYYFDRHPKSFLCVLTMFRTGYLHMIEDLCIINFSEDLEYWGVNENLMESCCHHRYHIKRERIYEEMKKIRDINEETNNIEQFGDGKYNQFRKKVWDLMENPQTSIPAQVVAVASVLFIFVSISCLTISTMEPFKPDDVELRKNTSNITDYFLFEVQSWQEFIQYMKLHALENVEIICIIWFTFEYISRLFACPNKKNFLKSPMNMIDLLAILPYYVSLIFTKAFNNNNIESLKVVQVFRILRVLRILKLARHSTGLQALGYTLQKSYKELGMLVMFIALGVLLFSSLIYFAERDINKDMFTSIPATFWWAIITMTTVGYGDMTPKSDLGKFIGSFCCICGVLVIALPIPIIVNNFADYYKDQLRREKTLKRKEDMAKAKQIGSFLMSEMDEDSSKELEGESEEEESSTLVKKRVKRSNSLMPMSNVRQYDKSFESANECNNDGVNAATSSDIEMQPKTYSQSQSQLQENLKHQQRPSKFRSHSPSHDSIFTVHSNMVSGEPNQNNSNYHQSQPEQQQQQQKQQERPRQSGSVPLVDTQAYRNLQSDIKKKIEKRYSHKVLSTMANNSNGTGAGAGTGAGVGVGAGRITSSVSVDPGDTSGSTVYEMTAKKRYSTADKNNSNNENDEKETLIEFVPNETGNSKNYFKKMMTNIIPKSQSASYLKYGPTKSL